MNTLAKFSNILVLVSLSTLTQSQYLNLEEYPAVPYPIAYNLHRLTEPRNVNDLSGAHLQRAKHDVSTTISQVQRLLALDPKLPRLTRGEIEELFENVTKEEYERSLQMGDHDRAKHMRALMLVLPYNTNSSIDGNLEELYTRPPITKMIDPLSNSKPLVVQMNKPSVIKYNVPIPQKPQIQEQAKLQPITATYKETTTYRPKKPVVPVLIKTTKTPLRITLKPTAFRPAKIIENPPQKMSHYDEAVIMAVQKNNHNKFSSHYSVHASPFMLSMDDSKTAQPPMRENVKDLLDAIGLYPDAALKPVKPLTQSMVQFKKLPEISLTSPSTTPQPKTSSVKPTEITPELKGLLQSFGFLNEADTKYKPNNSEYHEFKPLPDSLKESNLFTTPYVANHPDIVSDDFSSFKPIQFDENVPAKNNVDPEFENLLKSFGLIDFNQKRAKKSMTQYIGDYASSATITSTTTTTTERPTGPLLPIKGMAPVAVDMLPSSMIKILDNLGITTKKHNHNYDNTSPIVVPIDAKQSRKLISKKAHGFRLPNKTTDEEDFEKLKQLLETIKQLDKLNANLSDEEISKLNLKHYNLSDSLLLAHGPDPLDNIELINKKNEIKRQESNSEISNPVRISLSLTQNENNTSPDLELPTTTTATTTITENITPTEDQTTVDNIESETDTTITTTSMTEAPSRSDLEDSFANGADPVTEEPLPLPRRNGFYFLQDINTFLEVGEDPDTVEVRYERKFGDPSRFLPITVP